jgi:hypothetical protein
MQPSTFRLPDDEALVQAAWQRASAAHARLTDAARQATVANAARRAQGLAMIEVGQFSPPQAAPHLPAADVARLLDGQAQWFEREAARLEAQVAATQRPTASAGEPEAVLGPGPRPVPFSLCFAEVARGPWVWLRWLLFPPVVMGGGAAFSALVTTSSPAAVALVAVLLAALWGYGLARGVARIGLLSRGEVATVLQRTQRIEATRNTNVPMLAARGWDVTVEFFSGRSRQTDLVVQTSRGVIGKVSVSHGPDFHGVVLVDPETGAGCTNLDLGSVARPGRDGQWRASLPARVWITSALAPVVSAVLLGGAVLLATR